MTSVLILQNSPIEGPGLLGKLFKDDGFDMQIIDARHGKFPSKKSSVLVVLGGPQNANDDLAYLCDEQEIIQTYMKNNTPIIGICLGSQLLARACGAKVFSGKHTEFGFYSNMVPNTIDPLMFGLSVPFEVFHWHSDTFDLPANAVRLAHSDSYENQAFRVNSAIGLQFHLELGLGMINSWLKKASKNNAISTVDIEIARKKSAIRVPKIEDNMRKFYANFKSEFSL